MARKRMIDPHIWESAYDRGWSSDELAVMIAAISAADDEGFGRISMIKRNVSEMISERKLKKVFENLQDSISFFDKIYFFLPNWLDYQKISHPKESKIKAIYLSNNKDLAQKTSGIIQGIDSKKSSTSEVNRSEVNLKEVKRNESLFLKISEKIKELYANKTDIVDANQVTHINPLIEIWYPIPEELTREDIDTCLTKTFDKLSKGRKINVSYLVDNFKKSITEKHEEVLNIGKSETLNEANKARIDAKIAENKQNKQFIEEKRAEYKNFLDKNLNLFNSTEKAKIVHYLNKNEVLKAGTLIEPKMEEMELS